MPLTPEQRTDLQTLHGQRGPELPKIVAYANGDASRPVTGTTAPNVVFTLTAAERNLLKEAKALITQANNAGAGITKADLLVWNTLRTKLSTFIGGLGAVNQRLALLSVPLLYDAINVYKDAAFDTNEDATHDIGSQPILGDTWAVAHGFPNGITEEMIREAMKP